MSLFLSIPVLETERLFLRGPEPQDMEPLAGFFAERDRSWGFGGPMNRNDAWRWFASSIGHWALYGKGFWTVTLKNSGAICGMVGIWMPEGWPEPELGWIMFEESEGKGIAHEAALAARAHAYGVWKMDALSSNIFPGNGRSVALAERLGCHYERSYDNVSHGTEMVYRHPAPEVFA